MANADFRTWLSQRGMSSRSAGDVCSRLRRVENLVGLQFATRPEMDAALICSTEFQQATIFVRSQLKRAAHLWLEFQAAAR